MSDSENKSGTETVVHDVVHTPGPWRAELQTSITKGATVWSSGGMQICETGYAGFDQANARLIAAAPDMLAAIQGALRIADLWRPRGNWAEEHWEEGKTLHMMLSQFEEIARKVV